MISDKDYKKILKQFHKLSDRHILVVETDMSSSDIQKAAALSNKIRKAGNELIALMRKNYGQLLRTRGIVSYLLCMVIPKTKQNVKISLISSMKCKSSIMSLGIIVELL